MMKTPPHPGLMLRDDVIEPLGLGVTDAAKKLGMSRVARSRALNGRAAISPDLAIRLELAGVSTAWFWTGLQSNYNLTMAMTHKQPAVDRLAAL